MKIAAIAAALCAVLFVSHAEARPRHHHARVAHQLYSPECNVSMPCEGIGKAGFFVKSAKMSAKESRRLARGQELYDAMPFGMPTDRAGNVILPHPAGCPRRAFCGCGAAVEVFGKPVRSLWLAATWLRFPRATPAPVMV